MCKTETVRTFRVRAWYPSWSVCDTPGLNFSDCLEMGITFKVILPHCCECSCVGLSWDACQNKTSELFFKNKHLKINFPKK